MDALSKLLFTGFLLLALLARLFPVGNAALPDSGMPIEPGRAALVRRSWMAAGCQDGCCGGWRDG